MMQVIIIMHICIQKCVDYEIHLNNFFIYNFFSSLLIRLIFISKFVKNTRAFLCAYLTEIPPSSSLSQGNLIIIREHTTPSSCDTVFTDAISSVSLSNLNINNNNPNYQNQNLTITKLEQLDIESDVLNKLEIVRNDPISVLDIIKIRTEEGEMPIVKNSSSTNGQQDGSDKGIFHVSRIKKVELSEIPLASDICNTTRK